MAYNESLIYGEVTRELWELFDTHAGGLGVLTMGEIRALLNQISIFPTKSQVYEFVHTACEASGRTPVDHITFPEFCFLVMELQESYRKNFAYPAPQHLLQVSTRLQQRRQRRRKLANFKVFLGGSCNPTTWRADKAIPFLKQHGITFYNPQVSNWKPELMEIEDQAKQTAELLFFVIDNQTRSTASMVEAAYLSGCGRQLILIIRPFGDNVYIAGEPVSVGEVEDLERSHAYLTDLVERQCIPVFTDMDTALNCTKRAIKHNIKVSELTLGDGAQQVKYPHIRVADKFLELKEAYNSYTVSNSNNGKLSQADLSLAYEVITGEKLPSAVLAEKNDNAEYTFDEFCCLVSEYRHKKKSMLRRIMGGVARIPARMYGWFRGSSEVSMDQDRPDMRSRDVFLGGTCGKSTWREDIAIPLLRKKGIHFYNPQRPEWSTRYISLEAVIKDSCRVLMYVITGDTRGITSMCEVGHYIGMGCNIVLCLQNIPDDAELDGEKLTDYAVKDYNRARTYLADLANRDGIPVFSDINEATAKVCQILQEPQT